MKGLPRFFCSGGNKIFILCRKFRHIIRVYYTNTESCRLPARLLIGPGPIGLAIVRVSRYNNRRAVINRLMARVMTPYRFLDNLKMITDGMDAAAFKAAI